MPVASHTTGPRLAAVWFADICGFTRLAARDEPGALELVALLQRLAAVQVARQHGRVVKHVGDAVLAEFPSARSAARAALCLVREFEQHARPFVRGVPLHVGLHIGEISEAADGDVYGEGVNIAARLQEQAPPGAVLVSGDAWRQLRQVREFRARRDARRALRDVAVRISTYILTPWTPPGGEQAGAPDVAERAALLPPLALVGRSAEVALLRTTVDRLLEGCGGTLLLPGEAGVGKTRLAQVIALEAAGRAVQVASGRAYPVESGVPYALITDALLPLARRHMGSTGALDEGDELASLFPVFRRGHERAFPADDPAEFKGRLLWTFTERLRALARHAPLALILDDVQWADASSLELLHFLARQTADDPILIVCTYIDGAGAAGALRAVEQSLLGLGVARVHRVEPLDPPAVRELIAAVFDCSNEEVRRFADTLHRWTGGNVFFAQEVLQSLVASGRLRRIDAAWEGWNEAPLELPRTVRQAVMQRVQQLTPAARVVAGIAAVVGARVPYRLLRAAAGIPESDLLAGIDALCGAGVLMECVGAGGSVSFDFRHPIAREVLYQDLGRARRARLHGTIADVLERAPLRAAGERVDDLAYHFAHADPEEYAPRAIRYLIEAGTAALRRFANQEAADYLAQALEVAGVSEGAGDRAMPGGMVAEDGLRVAMDRLARARQRLGQYDAASALLRMLLDDAARRADTAAVANLHRRIGLNCFWAGRHADALHHLHAGVEAAQRGGTLRTVARTELALGACYQELGRAQEAAERVAHAHAIASELGDDSLAARTHRALLMLHTWIGPAETARQHGALAVELAERRQEPTVAFFSHWTLAVLEGLTGNTDRMADHIRECERRAQALSSPLLRLWVDELSIEYAWACGDWQRGLAAGETAIALARSLDQPKLLPRLLVWTSLILLGQGNVAAAEAMVEEAWLLSGAADEASGRPLDVHVVVPAHIGRASVHLARREYREAIQVAEAGLAIADRSGYPFWAIHRLLPIIGEAALYLRDLDRAESVDRRLRSDSERLGHRLGLAWAEACRALAVWLRGDLAGGTALLREAVDGLDAIPIVPDAARLRRQLAGRLLEMGARDAALDELTNSFHVFQRLGAEPELENTRAMFHELGAPPPDETADAPRTSRRASSHIPAR